MKSIEEPPKRTTFIFLTKSKEEILPTIVSRSQCFKLSGLKEKLIAAYNSGIKTVYVPEENQKDLFDIPEQILNCLEIKLVNNFEKIYDDVFRKNNVD